MPDITIGILSVVALLVFVFGGVHVAVALVVVSVASLFFQTGSMDLALRSLSSTVFSGSSQYVLAVIPLFVLMGSAMSGSRIADQLFALMDRIFRRLRGGLAMSTVFANAGFSAVTGISLASAAIFARIAVPQMTAVGYSRRLALGAVAGSSVLGMLIPPSVLLILYGILTQTSIGGLFIAGIIPGILLACLFSLAIFIIGTIHPDRVGLAPNGATVAVGGDRAPDEDRFGEGSGSDQTAAGSDGRVAPAEDAYTAVTAPVLEAAQPTDALAESSHDQSLVRLLAGTLPVMLLIGLSLGGIWLGFFTATEASAVGALGALVLAPIYGMRRASFVNAWKETAYTTGSIMMLLVGALLFSRSLALSGLTTEIGQLIADFGSSRIMLVASAVLVLLVLGTIMDSASILIITVPFFLPGLGVLGLDPVWFGIVMIIAVEMGLLTPPFGTLAFVMNATLGDDAKVEDVFIGALPFLAAMLVLIVLLVAFPPLATWLPGLVVN